MQTNKEKFDVNTILKFTICFINNYIIYWNDEQTNSLKSNYLCYKKNGTTYAYH